MVPEDRFKPVKKVRYHNLPPSIRRITDQWRPKSPKPEQPVDLSFPEDDHFERPSKRARVIPEASTNSVDDATSNPINIPANWSFSGIIRRISSMFR